MDEDEAERLRAQALEDERRIYEEELLANTPRNGTMRTPPTSFASPRTPYLTPTSLAPNAAKRLLSSPDVVVPDPTRRRVTAARTNASQPAAATTTVPPAVTAPTTSRAQEGCGMSLLSTAELVEAATAASGGVMDAVRCKTSKLNKDEVASIGYHVNSLNSVVMHLMTRLAAAEQRAALAESRSNALPSGPLAESVVHSQPASYASAIKLGRNVDPFPMPRRLGPAVAVFPAEEQKEKLRTADDTKKVLQHAVNPAGLGIRVAGIRRTGNAGIIVQTGSDKEAQALRAAVPTTLRTSEPRERRPLVSLVGVDAEIKPEDLLARLHEQNLVASGPSLEVLRRDMKPLFSRNRRSGKKLWVCEASPEIRRALVEKGRIYLGWDVVEVNDFVDVTCCRRCQMFGHPEKYCRAKAMTCGKCGEDGHKNAECQAKTSTCATCRKLGKKGHIEHSTNARDCPARKHAEGRAIQQTNYGPQY